MEDVEGFVREINALTEECAGEEINPEELNQILQVILNESSIGLLIIQDDQALIVNWAFEHITGFTLDEIGSWISHEFLKYIHPEYRRPYLLSISKGIFKVDSMDGDIFKCKKKTGEEYWVKGWTKSITVNKRPANLIILTDISAQKKTEEEVKRAEKLAAQYFEHAGVFLIVIDKYQRVQSINRKGCEILQMDRYEVLGKNWFDTFIPLKDRCRTKEGFQQLIHGNVEQVEYFENYIHTRGGEERLIAWHVTLLRDDEGNIIATLNSGEDITERRRSEEYFRIVADFSANWDYWIHPTEGLRYISPSCQAFTGYAREDFFRDPHLLEQIIHSEDLPRAKLFWENLGEECQTHELEFRILTRDGNVKWMEHTCRVVRDRRGESMGIRASNRDITARVQAESALQKSENRYRNVVEDQTDLICRSTPDGILTFVNETYCRYFNKSREDLVGRIFFPTVPAHDELKLEKHLDELSPDHPVATVEHQVILPNGMVRWHVWTDRAIYDHQGNVVEYQSVGRDITERKVTEQKLRENDAQFKLLNNQLPAVLWVTDKKLRITSCFGSGFDNSGYKPRMFIGRKIPAILDTDKGHPIVQAHLEALRGFSSSYEINFMEKFNIMRVEPFLDEAGRVVGTIGIAVDKTEQKLARQEINLFEQKFCAIFDKAPLRVNLFDAEGNLIQMNDNMRKLFGITDIVMGGFNLFQDSSFSRDILRGLREGNTMEINRVYDFIKDPQIYGIPTTRTGILHFHFTLSPIRVGNAPKPNCYIGIVKEITEIKEAEILLRESEEKLRTVATNIPYSLFLTQNGKIEFVNKPFCDLWATNSRNILHRDIDDLLTCIYPEHHEIVTAHFREMASGELGQEGRFFAIIDNGKGKRYWGEFFLKNVEYRGKLATFIIIRHEGL